MSRRARLVRKEDGTVESSTSKYNGKLSFGKIFLCMDAVILHIEEELKEVRWFGRCATRIEKGKDVCSYSPTIDEKWVQNVLGEQICENGVYDEEVARNKADRIFVFSKNLEIRCKDESMFSIKFIQNKM